MPSGKYILSVSQIFTGLRQLTGLHVLEAQPRSPQITTPETKERASALQLQHMSKHFMIYLLRIPRDYPTSSQSCCFCVALTAA